jgi:hypothetical protein
MTSRADAGNGTREATVMAMSEDEAVDAAKEIVAIAYQLREELRESRTH